MRENAPTQMQRTQGKNPEVVRSESNFHSSCYLRDATNSLLWRPTRPARPALVKSHISSDSHKTIAPRLSKLGRR